MTANDLIALAITISFGALVSGSPLLFATIGEIFSERAGVMNLGLEGMMLIGAMSGFATWVHTDSIILGLIVGMIFGSMFALLHAFITISLRADQVVSGRAVEEIISRAWCIKTSDQVHQCRFSRPRWTHDRNIFIALYSDGNSAQSKNLLSRWRYMIKQPGK